MPLGFNIDLKASYVEWSGSTSCGLYDGSNSWLVTFKDIGLYRGGGEVPVVKKDFPEGTTRVWKFGYVDEEGFRVVMAGRTGKEEDDYLFLLQKD